jgi:manganese efflux pump family protein
MLLRRWLIMRSPREESLVPGLLAPGLVLSLDNFRSSLVLGGLKPAFLQSVKTSAIFGVRDGVAPVAGIIIGHFLSDKPDNSPETADAE